MRQLLTTMMLCCCLTIQAAGDDTFVTIDWSSMPLNDEESAPEYRHTETLESGGAWSVSVEYPEYEALAAYETADVERYADRIGEDIHVESEVYEVRGEWRITYHCLPLIYRDGKYQRLLSARFRISKTAQARTAVRAASTVAETRYAARSAMASGRWVKISIAGDGMYRLTPAFLLQAGFTNLSKVHLYGYGGHLQSNSLNADEDFDDLPEIPLYPAADGSLLFWGNGLVNWNGTKRIRNTYAREACYFLSDVGPDGSSDNATRIETIAAGTASGQTVSSVMRHSLIEREEYSMYKVGNKLVSLDDFADGATRSYTFSGINASGRVQLTLSFASAGLTNRNTLTWNANGSGGRSVQISATNKEYQHAVWYETTADVTSAGTDSWTINMRSNSGIEAHLDYLALHYNAPLALKNGYTWFTATAANTRYEGLTGAANLKVMRLAKKGSAPCLVETEGSSVVVPTDGYDYVAFDASYHFPTPALVGAVSNQNLHGWDSPDMLIVLPQGCTYAAQAERLAEAHRKYDGMTVAIAWIGNIYNEFSSGTADATAVRRFCKMLYDRGEDSDHRLKYVLMMADGAWDNRMLSTVWQNADRSHYLPCVESDESGHAVSSYVTDDYYGMVGDSTGSSITILPICLAVGRFPVTTAEQAKILTDKTIRHISNANAGNWRNTAVYIGDDDATASDYAAEMKGADRAAEAALNPDDKDGNGIAVRKVMVDTYVRSTGISGNTYPDVARLIEKYQTEGALMINYTGHAAPHVISHESIVTLKDTKAWRGENLPLWLTAACETAPWDGQEDNLGESTLLNANGGAVAYIGTTRTVYSTPNHNLNTSFSRKVFATDSEGKRYSAGWALAEAKNENKSTNSLNYSFLGDPAVVYGAPRQKVVIDLINDNEPSREVWINSSSRVKIDGHIEDGEGNVADDFNGTLSVTLYDAKQTLTGMRNVTTSDYTYRFRDYNTMLTQRTAQVEDGKWSVNLIMPKDILFADSCGRMVFYAVSDDKKTEASGASTDFIVGGVGTDFEDLTEGPKMFLYLNNEDFKDGDMVNATPYFYAHLKDVVDISYLGNSVGHNLMLTIDNDPLQTYAMDGYFTPDGEDYTRGVVARNLPAMENGEHSLVFEAWNNQNLYSRGSLRFVVDNEMEPDPVSIAITPNPATTTTNIVINHRFPGSDTFYEVRIYDINGHVLWTSTEETQADGNGSHTVRWNLTNASGGKVSSGLYPIRVTVRSGDGEEIHEGEKIIVLDNK